MLFTNSCFEIMAMTPNPLKLIEKCGRVCYKTEDAITENSYIKFINMIMKRKHFSVIEHPSVTVKIISNRGLTHELVRHRLCSFSQESTRYCNYEDAVKFIVPTWISDNLRSQIRERFIYTMEDVLKFEDVTLEERLWLEHMWQCEDAYINLMGKNGVSPQNARGVLPIDLKTEIIITANLREWMHIFEMRTSIAAHPEIRAIMTKLLLEMQNLIPIIFDEI